jgi:hypothetical protein
MALARRSSTDPSAARSAVWQLVRELVNQLGAKLEPDALAAREAGASAFLLCYKRYGDSACLFELLITDLSGGNNSTTLRLGYWRFLFLWVKLRFRHDFYVVNRGRRKLMNDLLDLLVRSRRNESDALESNRILLLMLRHARQYRRSLPAKGSVILPVLPPPVVSTTDRTFWSYEPREVAGQMTLIEANMFRAIRPEEFYKKGWQDPDQAPVLHLLISRSNSISSWVASNILCQSSAAARSRALARFVLIAQVLEEMGNFNSLVNVLGGLKLWAITRLQGVITLHKTYRTLLAGLEFKMSPAGNYRMYRALLPLRQGAPFIPYLGLYLKDLTFIEDGNPDLLADGRINQGKIALFGNVLREIEQLQRGCVEYNRRIPSRFAPLLDYLARFPRMSDEEMSVISLQLRPSKLSAEVLESASSGFAQDSKSSSSESSAAATTTDESSETSGMKQQTMGGDSGASRVLRFLPPVTPREKSALDPAVVHKN